MMRFPGLLGLGTTFLLFSWANAIPVDNGVEGEPEIDCGPTSITVNFNTQQPFEGHVYVKGLYATPGCRNDDNGRQVAGITMPFNTCGISRQRSLNPRGVFVSTTIIVSFHPLFVTKVDRAYRIQCFYMEADKTVDSEIDVSQLTTGYQSQVVPMPVCRYEILDGSPNGPIIDYVTVGQQVYHKWTCDTETVDTFCMVVHSCYVDDNNGDRVDLLGPDGCALDIYLLNNPEYPADLMAGVEAHVFKYADRPQLYFQCQVTIIVKEPGGECPRPSCATPPGRGGPRPAGPQPPPPANPFPLVPGSPYLPRQGEGNPVHGPGDPSAPFAPHPGRPDPNTFHLPGPRVNVRPAPRPRSRTRTRPFNSPQPSDQRQPASPRLFQPQGNAQARPFDPRGPSQGQGFDARGSARPFDARNAQPNNGRFFDPRSGQQFGNTRPFNDAPALDTADYNDQQEDSEQRRRRRQVEDFENSAGTVDVKAEISALDIDDNINPGQQKAQMSIVPSTFSESDTMIARTQDGHLCFSAISLAVLATISLILVIITIGVSILAFSNGISRDSGKQ